MFLWLAKNHSVSAQNSENVGTKPIRATFCHVGGGHSEWHIQADALEIVKLEWDMVLAFPPCTHLATSGARHFDAKRRDGRQYMGAGFFLAFTALDHVPMVAIENPVGIMSSIYRKPDQIIQPYEFGDPHRKTTCLWLKGLPPLKPTKQVKPTLVEYECKNGKHVTFDEFMCRSFGGNHGKERSKTFPGIAMAMAEQWGALDVPAIEQTEEPKRQQWEQIRFDL